MNDDLRNRLEEYANMKPQPQNDQTLHPWQNTWPVYPLYPAPQSPCPGCGRCPVCGRGQYTAPFITWGIQTSLNVGARQ